MQLGRFVGRALMAALAASCVGVALAQGEVEPLHPDIVPTSSNISPATALVAPIGLKWTASVSDYRATFDICWPHEPDLIDEQTGQPMTETTFEFQNTPLGIVQTNASSVLGHDPPFCKKNYATRPGIYHFWCEIHRRNLQTEDVEVFNYYVDVYVGGGPLQIVRSVPANVEAFEKHRWDDEREANKFRYPWYCTDFGYSPFDNRTHGSYKPNNAQTDNIFDVKVEPTFAQPDRIKVWYTVTAPCVILTDNLGPGSVPERRKSKGLSGGTVIKVASDPVATGTSEFTISAVFAYTEDAAPVNSEPGEVLATDETPVFRQSVDVEPRNHPEQYTTFRTHRPKELSEYTEPQEFG